VPQAAVTSGIQRSTTATVRGALRCSSAFDLRRQGGPKLHGMQEVTLPLARQSERSFRSRLQARSLLSNWFVEVPPWGWVVGETAGMQGTSDPSRVELLDAQAYCRHLVSDGSVHAFLADHRRALFPDQLFADLFPSGRGGARRSRPMWSPR
jgi:hypothetical protein